MIQDPELEKLHADRIAALKVVEGLALYEMISRNNLSDTDSCEYSFCEYLFWQKEVEKREVLKRQGHGEYREITEGDFLGEVTGSEKVICHFYHREFYRCK